MAGGRIPYIMKTSGTRLFAAATVVACALGLGASATVDASADSSKPISSIDWSECDHGLECATFEVPVDWAAPTTATTTMNMVKLTATGDANGTLIANFGAGNSTLAMASPPPAVERLAESFDVVVFDPRGIGSPENGTFTECPEPAAPFYGLVEATTEEAWQVHADANARYDDGCRQAAADAFTGSTSWQMAHDIEAMRVALGEDELHYFGNSYGTAYAQAYLSLFPHRVGTMYLDGVADHTQPDLEDWLANYALTAEGQLHEFDRWCGERSGCALHDIGVTEAWDRLSAAVAQAPLPAPGAGEGETVDQGEFHGGSHFGMTPPRWPVLAKAMADALDGDASGFLTHLRMPGVGDEPVSVQGALLCHDYMPVLPDYTEAMEMESRLKKIAPRFGWIELRVQLGRCVGVSGEPAYPPHSVDVDETVSVLVGVGRLDNNTPHLGARHFAGQVPGAAVIEHGDGHAAFLLGNTCLADHVVTYFETGRTPPAGTTCPGELVDAIPDHP